LNVGRLNNEGIQSGELPFSLHNYLLLRRTKYDK